MKVFISHSSADKDAAFAIANALRTANFEVWEPAEILLAENWAEAIGSALRNSDAMIVLLTQNSLRSEHVQHAISFAVGNLKYEGRLIAVVASDQKLTEDQIPWILKKLHVIHMSVAHPDGDGLRQIVDTLKSAA